MQMVNLQCLASPAVCHARMVSHPVASTIVGDDRDNDLDVLCERKSEIVKLSRQPIDNLLSIRPVTKQSSHVAAKQRHSR